MAPIRMASRVGTGYGCLSDLYIGFACSDLCQLNALSDFTVLPVVSGKELNGC